MVAPRERLEDLDDSALVDGARAGDRAAVEALLRRHHDRIRVLCHRLCRDRGDAEDATQEALIAIVRGLRLFDGRSTFTTWSYRVASNSCMDELRRRGRRPSLSDDPDLVLELLDPSSRSTDPVEAVVQAELRSELQVALDSLPDDFRLPVVLRDLADLDYAEIAQVLDIAPGTVRSRISRGRTRLADLLQHQVERPDAAGNQACTTDVSQSEP